MNTIPYSQKVGSWLAEKSGCTLVDFCNKFNYPARETKIMSLDETDEKKSKTVIARDKELKDLYLTYAKDPDAISRKGENRSFTQYFKDLITGWILEDLTMEMLRRQGIDIEHNGKDRDRIIAIGKPVSQDADFSIKVGGNSRLVELTNEFNNVLEKNGYIEKRSPSLPRLHKAKGIWVYRDIPRGKYVMVDFATETVHLHLRHHDTSKSNWSKDVNRYVLSENGKKERDDRMLAAEIVSVVGCGIAGKEQPQLDEVEDEDSPPKTFTVGGVSRKNEQKPSIVHKGNKKPTLAKPPSPPMKKEEEMVETSQIDEIATDFDEVELPSDVEYGGGDFV